MSTTTTEIKTKERGLRAVDTLGREFKVPDFTIKDILSAIPARCYERSVKLGLYYVFRDLFCIATIGYLANTYIPLVPFMAVRVLLWAAYTVVQGLLGTGIWVLAHECGHQAFSPYGWVNDTVGWVLHSALFVPYFSWKYSHGKHHKATGNLQRDMVFVPKSKEKYLKNRGAMSLSEIAEEAPIMTVYHLFLQQIGGWIMHLFTNVTGQEYPERKAWEVNHFYPKSPLFEQRDYWNIVLSDIGILLNGAAVYYGFQKFGTGNMMVNYIIPWIFVNHWLVFITYLQHTGPNLPHYEAYQWDFARGAAATVDREFGFVGKYIFHDIIETHVAHHYVSRIPFYHGREATKAIKEVMGEHYLYDDTNMFKSLYQTARMCQFVDGENGVKMFRNTNNIGVGTGEKLK